MRCIRQLRIIYSASYLYNTCYSHFLTPCRCFCFMILCGKPISFDYFRPSCNSNLIFLPTTSQLFPLSDRFSSNISVYSAPWEYWQYWLHYLRSYSGFSAEATSFRKCSIFISFMLLFFHSAALNAWSCCYLKSIIALFLTQALLFLFTIDVFSLKTTHTFLEYFPIIWSSTSSCCRAVVIQE